jgi:electron transfer flavoprotein alpha subunit
MSGTTGLGPELVGATEAPTGAGRARPPQILVWLQEDRAEVTPESWGAARLAGRLKGETGTAHGLLITADAQLPRDLGSECGLDEIHVLRHEALSLYSQPAYLQALLSLWPPAAGLFLTSSTPDGRDLALALAMHGSLPCATRALLLEVSGPDLVAWQPLPGGSFMQQVTLANWRGCLVVDAAALERTLPVQGGPVTLRPWGRVEPTALSVPPSSAVAPEPVEGGGRVPPPPGSGGSAPRVDERPSPVLESRWKSEAILPADPGTVDVSEAEFVVCAGHGLQSRAGYEQLTELARLLGAAVGVTRPVVDEGWGSFERQIGQTGRYLTGRAYLGFGVSGAVHHTAGISDCELVIAVNKDPAAPVFNVADAGFVADAGEVVQALLEEVRARGFGDPREAGRP